MPNGEGTQRSKGQSKLTLQEWERVRENHLTIRFNREKHLIEIGWVCDCGDKTCAVPHTTVAFYSCPSKPCPPWTG
jgi:hypothetical protein